MNPFKYALDVLDQAREGLDKETFMNLLSMYLRLAYTNDRENPTDEFIRNVADVAITYLEAQALIIVETLSDQHVIFKAK
jgi:hypothetical protein